MHSPHILNKRIYNGAAHHAKTREETIKNNQIGDYSAFIYAIFKYLCR